MIVRAIRLREAITYFRVSERPNFKASTKERPTLREQLARLIFTKGLTLNDWEVLKEYVRILVNLKSLTKLLEGNPNGDSYISFSDWVPIIEQIMENLEDRKSDYEKHPDQHYWVAIEQGWKTAQKYFNLTGKSPAYAAALIFDPRKNMDYVRKQKHWGESWVKIGRAHV